MRHGRSVYRARQAPCGVVQLRDQAAGVQQPQRVTHDRSPEHDCLGGPLTPTVCSADTTATMAGDRAVLRFSDLPEDGVVDLAESDCLVDAIAGRVSVVGVQAGDVAAVEDALGEEGH